MEKIIFDLNKHYGAFKPLNATNGAPILKRHALDMVTSNYRSYKNARIPYSRNHDANLSGSVYGGYYSHDISGIFPNFDADETDPANYIFENTDECILCTLETDTKTFYRLGQSIENQIRKIHVFPPKDYLKWAKICERIIRHYTEGWANGFNLDMPYWEIWNEPDNRSTEPDKTKIPTWAGTKEQFFDFYEVSAKYLKDCFPNLKIGGPALAYDEEWAEEFLSEMQKREVPIDFFSWHGYNADPMVLIAKGERIRGLLDKYGYVNAESICNEWNYVQSFFGEDFNYSVKKIHGEKGASFIMTFISEAQKSSIDMLMYYDTRPGKFNGVFDYYDYSPLKGYYALMWYGKFYDLKHEVRAISQPKDIYTLCGVNNDGKVMAIVTHYSNDDQKPNVQVELDFGKKAEYDIYVVDKDTNGELVKTTSDLVLDMPVQSFALIVEK